MPVLLSATITFHPDDQNIFESDIKSNIRNQNAASTWVVTAAGNQFLKQCLTMHSSVTTYTFRYNQHCTKSVVRKSRQSLHLQADYPLH